RSLEAIRGKLPGQGLPADRGSERAVLPNRAVDLGGVDLEPRLAGDVPALNRQRHIGRPASANGRRRRAGPLAIIRTGGASSAKLQEQQKVARRRDAEQALHWTLAG